MGARGGSHCDFADPGDAWVWAPAGCRLRRFTPLEAQRCLEEPGRRVIIGGSSPQRTLFFDLADVVFPGEVLKYKAHQDLEFPPVCFFHWVPYFTDSVPGCPLDCDLDYQNVTGHIDAFLNATSRSPDDVLVVQAGIHDIFFGSIRTYTRNLPWLAVFLASLKSSGRLKHVLFRIGDAMHLPRGGDQGLVNRGFRSQRMLAAHQFARRVMKEVGVTVLDTLQTTISRPEGTADGYHFNEWACLEDVFRGNAISRVHAHALVTYACPEEGHDPGHDTFPNGHDPGHDPPPQGHDRGDSEL